MAWLNGPNNTLANIAEAVAAGLPFLDEITALPSTTTTTTTAPPASVSANFSQLYMDIWTNINSSLQDSIACGHQTQVLTLKTSSNILSYS